MSAQALILLISIRLISFAILTRARKQASRSEFAEFDSTLSIASEDTNNTRPENAQSNRIIENAQSNRKENFLVCKQLLARFVLRGFLRV